MIRKEGQERDRRRSATYLGAIFLEKARRIHAVGDGTPYQGKPMEDNGRLIGLLEEDLVQDIEDDGEDDEADGHNANLRRG